MILLFISLFQYNASFNSFKVDTLYAGDIEFSLAKEVRWFKGFIEGGIGCDFSPSGSGIGFYDITIGGGVKRDVMGIGFSLFPLIKISTGGNGTLRKFSIDGYGYGIEVGLETRVFSSYLGVNARFVEFETDPNIREISFNTKVNFNPDTLTFGLNFSFERFFGRSHSINCAYLSPNVTLCRWRLFALTLGVDFRVTREAERIPELQNVGVNTGNIGVPPWKVYFGVSSAERFKKDKRLILLRVILLDEEGIPVDGLLCLADSGSFEVKDGEIQFELPDGIYPISIYVKDCMPVDTTIILKSHTELLLNVSQKKALGILEGKVFDTETGEPLSARLFVKNSEGIIIDTDPSTGSYRAILPPGDYIIQVLAEGYFPRTSLTEVTASNLTALDFKLLPVQGDKE